MKKSITIKIIDLDVIICSLAALICMAHSEASAEIIGPPIKRVSSEEQMVAAINAIALTDKNGSTVGLNKFIGNGKPTLITLWERGCPNCITEMRGMTKVQEACPTKWNVIYITITQNQVDKDQIKFEKSKLPWTLYHLGPEYFSSAPLIKIRKAFSGESEDGIVATPLHYLISKDGVVDAIVNAKLDLEDSERLSAFCAK